MAYWADYCYKLRKKNPKTKSQTKQKNCSGWNLRDSCLPKPWVVWDALGCGCVGFVGHSFLQSWAVKLNTAAANSLVGQPKSLATSVHFSPVWNSFGWSYFKIDNDIQQKLKSPITFVKLLLNVISMSVGMTGGNASTCGRTESMRRDQVTYETLMVIAEQVLSLLCF